MGSPHLTSRFALITTLFAAGCTGVIDLGETAGVPALPSPSAPERAFVPAPLQMKRLQAYQYRGAIADLLGEAAAAKAAPPPDTALAGFDAIGASQLALSTSDIQAYEKSALAVAEAAFADVVRRRELVGCAPANAEDGACMSRFIARFGRRAFRRTLDDEEVARWRQVGVGAGKAYGDFHKGAAYAVAGMLQSPHFLYLVASGTPEGDRLRLTGQELAARLAFYLTGSIPSDALLIAGETGELDTREGLERHARELMQHPGARRALTAFFDELLKLRELDELPKSTAEFPAWTPALRTSMRQETLLLLEDVVWDRDADFRDVFDAPYTFVDPVLAKHYGLAVDGKGPVKLALPPESLRGGLLGHASFLASMAHTSTTSPTLRGKFIREMLMCQTIPSPPPGVDTTLKPVEGTPRTMRERLQEHQNNPSCSGCHKLMDPIGLGLENFDAIGAFRTSENGATIDAFSEIPGLGGFAGARQLGTLLKNDPAVGKCLVRNVFRHATGHVETEGEEVLVDALYEGFVKSGFRLRELLVAVAASDAFRLAALPPEAP